ncbi:zinc-binding dehydrogenase [Actinospica robiniae]|uniref:zinc-binding dehydrogenase n=1 Tax=Actinospica robiniae TaxID=304901 RepID=UPI00041CC823|nr:zinc-binding dehydrogenase [Actinospica robiniae]
MQAVVLCEFGPPAALGFVEDWPEPVLGPGQALVDVAYAGITFVETQIRAGRPPNPAMAPALPAVLGNGVGGVVTAVGPDVDEGLVGTRVVAAAGGRGGYAEWCAVPVSGLVAVPETLALDAALALLADGRTALALADAAEPRPGETVLVEAAAGGVGSLLVQLAARAGARVIALAGGQRKLELARELGAYLAVDYLQPDWAATVAEQVGTLDVVYDGVGGGVGREAFELLAADGRYAGFGMASGSFADIPAGHRPDVARVSSGPLPPERSAQLTRRALDLAAEGVLRPVIGQRFRLDQAADAHAAIESRATIGKTLLVVEGEF